MNAGVSLPDGDDGDRAVHVWLVRPLLLLRVLLHGHDANRPLPLARPRRRQHVCHGPGNFYNCTGMSKKFKDRLHDPAL